MDNEGTDTMKGAVETMRATLDAVCRAAGLAVGRRLISVYLHDAPIDLALGWAALGGKVDLKYCSIEFPVGAASDNVAIMASVAFDNRAAFRAALPIAEVRKIIARDRPGLAGIICELPDAAVRALAGGES